MIGIKPWEGNGGSMCKNIVFDDVTKRKRPITATERRIVDYCLSHSPHLNRACEEISCADRGFSEINSCYFKPAAEAIYERWHGKKRITNVVAKLLAFLKPDGSYFG